MIPFAPALLNPDAALPPGLMAPGGREAVKRFNVYRNNVVVSLKEALITGFPVLVKLVGEEFFNAMAGVFLRAHPPVSPVLVTYGDALPEFLEVFEPVAHLPYLADVARLELALRRAYHTADAMPIRPEALSNPDLERARLHLAPATQIIASPYPIHTIWLANTDPNAPPARGGAETVLITRPDWDPRPVRISPTDASFVAALMAGDSFGAALEAAGDSFDLAPILTTLLDCKAITAIEVPA